MERALLLLLRESPPSNPFWKARCGCGAAVADAARVLSVLSDSVRKPNIHYGSRYLNSMIFSKMRFLLVSVWKGLLAGWFLITELTNLSKLLSLRNARKEWP